MNTVIPVTTQDYSAWHKNRPYFCVWYIGVDDSNILNYCQMKQKEFSQFLTHDYNRQFHITLFVNGFWVENQVCDDDFNLSQLTKQINVLNELNLKPFKLNLSNFHSFDNCLSIQVLHNNNLINIRNTLKSVHDEISPSYYIPHITLGFYKDYFLKQTIYHRIKLSEIKKLTLTVNKLTCGVYNAQELQGQLTPIYEFEFGKMV